MQPQLYSLRYLPRQRPLGGPRARAIGGRAACMRWHTPATARGAGQLRAGSPACEAHMGQGRGDHGATTERRRSDHGATTEHVAERPRSGAGRYHGAARRFPTEQHSRHSSSFLPILDAPGDMVLNELPLQSDRRPDRPLHGEYKTSCANSNGKHPPQSNRVSTDPPAHSGLLRPCRPALQRHGPTHKWKQRTLRKHHASKDT